MTVVNKWRADVIDKSNPQNRRIYYDVGLVRTERVFELGEWVYKLAIGFPNNSGIIIYNYFTPDTVKVMLTTYKEAIA